MLTVFQFILTVTMYTQFKRKHTRTLFNYSIILTWMSLKVFACAWKVVNSGLSDRLHNHLLKFADQLDRYKRLTGGCIWEALRWHSSIIITSGT